MARPGLRAMAALAVTACTLGVGLLATVATPASAQPGATTTTLPVDDRDLGNIIPKPNSGRAPETPGDPGGWLQVSLFFLICAAIAVIFGFVWWRSRRIRQQRAEAGQDPVSLARARGEGVRKSR